MTTMIDKLDHYRSWIGKTDTREDLVTAYPVRAVMATLDTGDAEPRIGDELPPYWHMFVGSPTKSELR